jgi:hypothetical protein
MERYFDDVVLNKTADGKFWLLTGWPSKDTRLFRLRIAHASNQDVSHLWAEVGVLPTPDDTVVWTPIAGPFHLYLTDPMWTPEEEWTAEFPNVDHKYFLELGRVLGRIGEHIDLESAFGPWRPCSTSSDRHLTDIGEQ